MKTTIKEFQRQLRARILGSVSHTPRTDMLVITLDAHPGIGALADHARDLETELIEAQARIKRLEEIGNRMEGWCNDPKSVDDWRIAMEDGR